MVNLCICGIIGLISCSREVTDGDAQAEMGEFSINSEEFSHPTKYHRVNILDGNVCLVIQLLNSAVE